jgi:hypothetical protein
VCVELGSRWPGTGLFLEILEPYTSKMINNLNDDQRAQREGRSCPRAFSGLIDKHSQGKPQVLIGHLILSALKTVLHFFERPGERQQQAVCEFSDFRKCVRSLCSPSENDGGRLNLQS